MVTRKRASAAADTKPGTPKRRQTKPAAAAAAATDVAAKARRSKPSIAGTVARTIRSSPVGKAAAVTQALMQSRKTAQLARRVRNKVVVVTGASSGIGEDCALKLAAAGATVILAARTPAKLQATLDKIEAGGGKAFAYACDIADMAACDRFVKTVLDEHRHVDILINNAGRSIRRSVKHSFDRFHDFERTMQLNYFGALRVTMGLLPGMSQRRRGQFSAPPAGPVQFAVPEGTVLARHVEAGRLPDQPISRRLQGPGDGRCHVRCQPGTRRQGVGPVRMEFDLSQPVVHPDAAAGVSAL